MFLVAKKCNETSAERGSFDLVSIRNGAKLCHSHCSKRMLLILMLLEATEIVEQESFADSMSQSIVFALLLVPSMTKFDFKNTF